MRRRGSSRVEQVRRALRIAQLWNVLLFAAAAATMGLALAGGASAETLAGEAEAAGVGTGSLGLIAAALATGVGALGAGYAVAHVGAASVGAMAERPEVAGRALIFVGLAEGIAIYGLIISVMILGRL